VSNTVLERILAATRQEVARRKRELPLEALMDGDACPPAANRQPGTDGPTGSDGHVGMDRGSDAALPAAARPFHVALTGSGSGIAVIAEFKRRSPSAGALRERPDVTALVSAYERGGARAVSVLTEGPHFDGSLDDLRLARATCALPILRKDFIVDPYQLHEARAAGADAVLLIVAALDQSTLSHLHQTAGELGLDALVEVHDRSELGRAIDAGAALIGINNRDLRDFSVDVERTFALLEEVPKGVAVVSESGIATSTQLRRLAERGVQGVLVGELLMRSPDPEAALRELLGRSTDSETARGATGRGVRSFSETEAPL
jgi:indole-3-glycerol phosphate synthase